MLEISLVRFGNVKIALDQETFYFTLLYADLASSSVEDGHEGTPYAERLFVHRV